MAKLTEILRRRFEGIKREHKEIKEGKPPGSFIPTGLREFDRRGGHKRKQVTLYAGETGVGKSLWKLHCMRSAAMAGYTTTVIDMEDPEERTADRGFAIETGINSAKMLSADLTDAEVFQIGLAVGEMEEWSDLIEYFDGVKTAGEAMELFEENPADQEIVDYLSAFPHGKHGRERTISDFFWDWTKHCQEKTEEYPKGKAGIGFGQLSPDVSKRGLEQYHRDRARQHYNQDGKQNGPYIDGFRGYDAADIMWCTDVGRTAKECGFMFRPGRILKRLKHKADDNVMEFDFPKRNWGAEGRIRVAIDLKTARFSDLAEKEK